MENIQEQQRINAGLKRLRFLRRSLGVIVITFVPVVYLLLIMDVPERIIMTIGITMVCLGVVIELVIGFSRCPACKNFFHVRGMSGNIFARKCMNCGIPLKQQG